MKAIVDALITKAAKTHTRQDPANRHQVVMVEIPAAHRERDEHAATRREKAVDGVFERALIVADVIEHLAEENQLELLREASGQIVEVPPHELGVAAGPAGALDRLFSDVDPHDACEAPLGIDEGEKIAAS